MEKMEIDGNELKWMEMLGPWDKFSLVNTPRLYPSPILFASCVLIMYDMFFGLKVTDQRDTQIW